MAYQDLLPQISVMLLLRQIQFLLLIPTAICAYAGIDAQLPIQWHNTTSVVNSTSCHQACLLMQDVLGHNAYYTTFLDNFAAQYFSAQQRELLPLCVIQPESTEQVSKAITIIRTQDCIFTIRSGGHGRFAGTSSIHGGLVLDLSQLNNIELLEDESTVLIGTGSRWLDAYRHLEEKGLTVVGARDGSVGVGGFTLGGGISFISRRYGWALDNVRNFEVVLANGSIANVSQQTYPDLYFALRGGGNNFCIVTRFYFETHEQGQLWGGTNLFRLDDLQERRATLGLSDDTEWSLQFPLVDATAWIQRAVCFFRSCTQSTDIIDSFVRLANDEQQDRSANGFIFLSWFPLQRTYLAGTTISYDQPRPDPPVFRHMTSRTGVYTTNRLANMSDLSLEVEMENRNVAGDRRVWDTATFKVNATLISKLWDIFLFESYPITKLLSVSASCNIELLTKDEIAVFSKNGGNSLGINVEDGPLMLFSIIISYKGTENDELVEHVTQNIISRGIELAKEMGLHHRFIYQNYAGRGRDVFAGYGGRNHELLSQIQRKYDPDGVFQRLQPGYFKL
ncbi:hypothetical protein F5884DRAFT_870039 [Xylogone sp. PMI_703]|nr:hypothetical protein F5884DRAFT_870039 [Xylogone sp. PMI_703]